MKREYLLATVANGLPYRFGVWTGQGLRAVAAVPYRRWIDRLQALPFSARCCFFAGSALGVVALGQLSVPSKAGSNADRTIAGHVRSQGRRAGPTVEPWTLAELQEQVRAVMGPTGSLQATYRLADGTFVTDYCHPDTQQPWRRVEESPVIDAAGLISHGCRHGRWKVDIHDERATGEPFGYHSPHYWYGREVTESEFRRRWRNERAVLQSRFEKQQASVNEP